MIARKYRIERVLGAGGMGVVVAARRLTHGDRVALKLLRSAPQAAARLVREARALALLESAHVARILGAGEHEGLPYLVLELLEGSDLQVRITATGGLSVALAVEYIAQACEGVAAAHAAGIVHRDLKPQNLFVVRARRGPGLVKVLDFGVARSTEGADLSLTGTNEVVGTPSFMAPEQLRADGGIDRRADVWALGACLFAAIAARPPFEGSSVIELGARILRDEPPSLHALRADVPRGVSEIVARCLAKPQDERFPTVEALAKALGPFRSGDTQCLDDNVIAAMQDGAVGAATLAAIDRHLAGCDACRALVGTAAALSASARCGGL